MYVASVSTKTSTHYTNLQEVFKDLVKSKSPFNVHICVGGMTTFPVPFIDGKAANGNIEQCVRNILKQTFGTVEYEYNMGSVVSAA